MRSVISLANIPEWEMRVAARYRGLTFKWERWQKPNANWDHDHCFFCQACICDSGQTGYYAHAFVLKHERDSPFWVCRSCFKLVRQFFAWHIAEQGGTGSLESRGTIASPQPQRSRYSDTATPGDR
jgi:hypothetical protein